MLDNKILLENIKKLCDSKGIKITNLEKELGFGGGIISRWGNNADPSLSKIIDIADYFHVTLDEVVGRNQIPDENYNFINLIIEQTKKRELLWNQYFGQPYQGERCNIPEEINFIIPNFNKYPNYQRRVEKIYSKCDNGYFILSCYFILQNDIIDKYELFFYIQPEGKKEGILQKCNQEQLFNLFKIIDCSMNGESLQMLTDDFKAKYMQKHFINNYQESLNKVIQTKTQMDLLERDPNTICYLAQIDSPEIRQLIEVYTDPKMSEAIHNTQRIIHYLSQIKNIQKQNNSSKAKTFNEILSENNEDVTE